MFRNIDELLQHIVQLGVQIPVNVERVEPFILNDEQHYRVHFKSGLEPSGWDKMEVSLTEILLHIANTPK